MWCTLYLWTYNLLGFTQIIVILSSLKNIQGYAHSKVQIRESGNIGNKKTKTAISWVRRVYEGWDAICPDMKGCSWSEFIGHAKAVENNGGKKTIRPKC